VSREKNKALFLDRDGVINVERGYVHARADFHFQRGIYDLCLKAQALGYFLLVVTNQGGIARGYYTESDFLELTKWMIKKFAERRVHIAHVYYCPYHPVHGVGSYKYDSPERKPKAGMILRARADFNLDLASSILIGDQLSDIQAAEAAGIGTKILLRLGPAEIGMRGEQCYVVDSLGKIGSRFFSH
jgi:D-glycero-D-manno-heptose 1,7-bisphosphate phosphatase